MRAVALMTLGIVELWAGAGDDAERHLREALELARRIGRPYVEQGCLAHLAVAVARHSVTRRARPGAQALDILERYGWQSEPVVPIVFAAIGAVDVLQGRFDEAEPWLDRAEQSLRPNAEPAKEILVRYCRGLQRLGQGRLAEALALFAEAQRLQSFLVAPDPLAIAARALQVQTLVRLGDAPAARPRSRRHPTPSASTPRRDRRSPRSTWPSEMPAAPSMRSLPSAQARAPIILDFSLSTRSLLDALARDLLGDSKAAEDDVERALDLAEPDALILPFLITPARELLERHPRHRTAHAALLATILDVLAGSPLRARRGERAGAAEELTESEIRVLRYLPSNLSAPEIAAEMFLSTSTVKTHMRHIYEKLGAHKRTEAVDRARELGLLGPSARTRR